MHIYLLNACKNYHCNILGMNYKYILLLEQEFVSKTYVEEWCTTVSFP